MKKTTLILLILLSARVLWSYPVKGTLAPALKFTKVLNVPAGTKTDLAALKGKVVVLEFWATWCGPCVAAIPHLNELAGKLDPAKFQLIMANDMESESTVSAFQKKRPMAGWSALDADELVKKSYGVKGIPVTFIIDRRGRIVAATNPEDLSADDLQAVYDGKPVKFKPTLNELIEASMANISPPKKEERKPIFEFTLTPSTPEEKSMMVMDQDGTTEQARDIKSLVAQAFDLNKVRIDWKAPEEKQKYDLQLTMKNPDSLLETDFLQDVVTKAFELKAHKEKQKRKVLVLKATEDAKRLLTPSAANGGSMYGYFNGRFIVQGGDMDVLSSTLEKYLDEPVVNETGLTGKFDVSYAMKPMDKAVLKEHLEKDSGLVLVEEEREIEVLVVEKDE